MTEFGQNNNGFVKSLSAGQSLDSLISAPLIAISKANATMLSGQAQFILDCCFYENGGAYSPIMIKMEVSRGDDEKSYFYLPLLTILPLNNLAVDKVDVKFNIDVTSTCTHTPQLRTGSSRTLKATVLKKETKLGARIGSSSNNKNNENKINSGISVAIEAKQIPLAKGVTTLIDIYSKNIVTSKD